MNRTETLKKAIDLAAQNGYTETEIPNITFLNGANVESIYNYNVIDNYVFFSYTTTDCEEHEGHMAVRDLMYNHTFAFFLFKREPRHYVFLLQESVIHEDPIEYLENYLK